MRVKRNEKYQYKIQIKHVKLGNKIHCIEVAREFTIPKRPGGGQ